ncbi:P-loop NTPase fold protein [Pseudoalteromonas sp. DL2-H2.2]|uniref:P-loop NTPase fold protein n=1 Tax=Pseudoalteromonas sp. DL2-H2.2 TaxID=2908889 RepID=UPI003FA75C76
MTTDTSDFKRWEKQYSWENCKLGNEQYGKFISSYIKSQNKPVTLNINGSWGIGKTHFPRQLHSN